MLRLIRGLLSASIAVSSVTASAVNLSDYKPYEYEVLFTNPVCETYFYDQDVYSKNGDLILHKPKNVYCKKSDLEPSGNRPESPQYRLVEWIRDSQTKEIFFAYLSFSDKTIRHELCEAITNRNVKVKFVLHTDTGKTQADLLLECRPKNFANDPDFKPNLPEVHYTGNKGIHGEGTIGYAHNKLFVVNPNDSSTVKLAFSSGNMSSGTVLHHENWHFITTSPESYFYQAHQCLMEGVQKHDGSRKQYRDFVRKCKNAISVAQEDDIKTFWVPGEGTQAMNTIKEGIQKSKSLSLAAHRFSYSSLIKELKKGMKKNPDLSVRLITDDDIYWSGVLKKQVGSNTLMEFGKVMGLVREGMEVKYMETNQNMFLLHHNKFVLFEFNQGGAVFAGAGNFTGTAFKSNFENFYYITIPSVVEAFKKQYRHMWHQLATGPKDMPQELLMP